MDKLITWWEGYEPREQMIIAIVGTLFAVFLFFMLLIDPVMSWHDSERKKLAQSESLVLEVKELAARIKAKKQSGGNKRSNKSLSVLIDSSLRENELVMRGFQPGANKDARLRLENAAYPSLAQWLYDLEYRHNVTVIDLSLTPAKASGRLMVNVRVSQ
ncbi:MAG: type II secretion system protein GspM [Cellvibrionaceae bacterium]